MTWRADILIGGRAEGAVMRLDSPLSFWGGIDPATSEVVLSGHPQCGDRTAGRILVVPRPIGSCSSASVMLELLYRGLAPAALILGARDAILPVGVLVSRQMGWAAIPVLAMAQPPFRTGERLRVHLDGAIDTGA